MKIEIKSFADLSNKELYRILELRAEIFVVEQNCVYNDLDGLDQNAIHICGILEDELVAYVRIALENARFKEVSIGRVVVSSKHRGKQLGKILMEKSINYIYTTDYSGNIRISAQSYLKKFYQQLGFEIVSEEYLEDNIPHVEMIYTYDNKGFN